MRIHVAAQHLGLWEAFVTALPAAPTDVQRERVCQMSQMVQNCSAGLQHYLRTLDRVALPERLYPILGRYWADIPI